MPKTCYPAGVLPDTLQLSDVPEVLDLLLASKKVRLTIEGYSMHPALRPGDRVEVSPLKKETLEKGDLAVFRGGGKLVCHRVVEIFDKEREKWVKTKGDAMSAADPPIRSEQIHGTVMRVERNGTSWIPSPFPKVPSAIDAFSLFQKRVAEAAKRNLRPSLIRLQSFRLFRRFCRLFFRPKVTYSVGIPVSPDSFPKVWEILPFPTAKGKIPNHLTHAYRFFAKVKGNVIASLEIKTAERESPSEWHMTQLFVRAKYRGRGIASAVLKKAFQMLRLEGAAMLRVEVSLQNKAACALFKKVGAQGLLGEKPAQKDSVLFQKTFPYEVRNLLNDNGLWPYFYYSTFREDLFTSPAASSVRFSQETLEGLKNSFVLNAGRQLLFEKTFFEIGDAFQKKGIFFLVQKGMALAYLVYPDPAARPMVDMDLYLRKEDVPRARAVLQGLGYQMKEAEFETEQMTFGGELYFSKENAPAIELHWHLEQYERLKDIVTINEQELWDRAVPYPISGRPFKTFCPEHQLIHLAMHLGLVHRFHGPKWYLDIDRWVLRYGEEANWDKIFQTAKEWGIERVLRQILFETQEIFHTPLPFSVKPCSPLAKKAAFQWLLLDRTRDRLRSIHRVFSPSREWLIYRYRLRKRGLATLYRFLHPFFVLTGKTR
ncbi:MAG: GNAT family N-acetyltransferase [Candidatus Omnitrophota bacterium]